MTLKREIIYRGLTLILAVAFFIFGTTKLMGSTALIDTSVPRALVYFIGVAQVAGALGILFGAIIHRILPRLAALGLTIIMVGALVLHAQNREFLEAIPSILLFLFLLSYLYLNISKTISGK
ncbi:MAG: hypothetical protein UY04_C0016G0006 [Parcubacteria group bacterium GW2011_GWA2_47_7]|nr:MAG: hypothetical protein UY04_C0016G0006 [Parcubacteria group bacterium GW2011_GWA2_47_7]